MRTKLGLRAESDDDISYHWIEIPITCTKVRLDQDKRSADYSTLVHTNLQERISSILHSYLIAFPQDYECYSKVEAQI